MTLLISSCDRFSDLWEEHIRFLNRNWADRRVATLLVTDEATDRTFDGVQILSTGAGKEYAQRMQTALPAWRTEYALITLDDYFLIGKTDNGRIERLIQLMDAEGLDYIRLFSEPNSRKRYKDYDRLYEIPLQTAYAVNLYPGIWRRSFLEKTLGGDQTIWKYEVSLTATAAAAGARCVLSKGAEFRILDVIRKGKLLHKAKRYFKRRAIELPEREVISYREEWRLRIFRIGKKVLPRRLAAAVKQRLRRKGFEFFNDAF